MHKRGFTLIELLAVVLIISILTAVAVPQYRRSLERSRIAEAYQILAAIYDARERLDVEANITHADVNFDNLDINLKGQKVPNSNALQWNTGTFVYGLNTSFPDNDPWQDSVWAKLQKGPYHNLMLYFDGSSVGCCDGETNMPGEACDFFNIDLHPASCPATAGGGGGNPGV